MGVSNRRERMGWIEAADTEQLHKEADAGKGTMVLIYFTAPWCVPCQQHGPALKAWAQETKNVKVVSVNSTAPDFIEMIQAAGIKSLPTIHMVHNQKLKHEIKGLSADKVKEIKRNFDEEMA